MKHRNDMSGQTKIYIADNEELMKEWDYEANDGLNPKEITIGSHKRSGGSVITVAIDGCKP